MGGIVRMLHHEELRTAFTQWCDDGGESLRREAPERRAVLYHRQMLMATALTPWLHLTCTRMKSESTMHRAIRSSDLRQQLGSLRTWRHTVRAARSSEDKEVAELTAALEDMTTRALTAEENASKQAAERDDATARADRSEEAARKATTAVGDITRKWAGKLTELKKELQTAKADTAAAQMEAASAQEDAACARNEAAELQTLLETSEAKVAELTCQAAIATEERRQLEIKMQHCDADMEQLFASVKVCERRRRERRGSLESSSSFVTSGSVSDTTYAGSDTTGRTTPSAESLYQGASPSSSRESSPTQEQHTRAAAELESLLQNSDARVAEMARKHHKVPQEELQPPRGRMCWAWEHNGEGRAGTPARERPYDSEASASPTQSNVPQASPQMELDLTRLERRRESPELAPAKLQEMLSSLEAARTSLSAEEAHYYQRLRDEAHFFREQQGSCTQRSSAEGHGHRFGDDFSLAMTSRSHACSPHSGGSTRAEDLELRDSVVDYVQDYCMLMAPIARAVATSRAEGLRATPRGATPRGGTPRGIPPLPMPSPMGSPVTGDGLVMS